MGRSLAWPLRLRARALFAFPDPGDWHPIAAAIAEGWHVMLVWDADRNQWRCDLLRPGLIASGQGETIGAAGAAAWRETGPVLRAVGYRRRYRQHRDP